MLPLRTVCCRKFPIHESSAHDNGGVFFFLLEAPDTIQNNCPVNIYKDYHNSMMKLNIQACDDGATELSESYSTIGDLLPLILNPVE